ncbi:hypothetical protein [Algibacter luteus]|uniref:hypothetical protein n=1 Tax=Algibacter luteus TaxID=1178825 RepID=UPI002599C355|nr:hypothetical protein [Algibacter luteus]WJJ96346.1 hypothetical protein O5O44_14120 [Algibacter luteus]
MTATDFLTILGLALAVWALIPKKERNFVMLFFSKRQIIFFGISLMFLHYLFAFDWLLENWFPWLSVFTSEKGIPSSTWAYLFSLVLIGAPVLQVMFGFFSSTRRQELISLYNTLLKEDDIDLLVEYINKYHISDIQAYLKGLSYLPEKENIDMILRRRTEKDEAFDKLIKPRRMQFAANVYGRILQSDDFINKAASKYPELFATAFAGMESEKAANPDLVKLYIENIFESKNQSFVKELKIVNDSESSIESIFNDYDIPILYGLLSHTKTAFQNAVWYPVGEKGVKSLKYDSEQQVFLQKKYDSALESELWNQKIYIAIVYFDYMVRETIFKNNKWHMWLFYYRSFTKELIEIIPSSNDYDGDTERPSFTHSLIVDMIWIMRGWIELAKKRNVKHRVIDTIKCLGDCLDTICAAPEDKVSSAFKKRQVNLIISLWFEYSYHADNKAVKLARDWMEMMFLNPKGVDSTYQPVSNDYKEVMREAWRDFDKIPYQMHGENGSVKDFTDKIIVPLGIN